MVFNPLNLQISKRPTPGLILCSKIIIFLILKTLNVAIELVVVDATFLIVVLILVSL